MPAPGRRGVPARRPTDVAGRIGEGGDAVRANLRIYARAPRVVKSGDVSRNGEAGPEPASGWLDGDQPRAWLGFLQGPQSVAYEMNRQLLADSGMSLPDYDVLTALSVADGERMQITVLAAQIGW